MELVADLSRGGFVKPWDEVTSFRSFGRSFAFTFFMRSFDTGGRERGDESPMGPKGHESFVLDPLSPDEDLLNCRRNIVVTNCVKNTPLNALKVFPCPSKKHFWALEAKNTWKAMVELDRRMANILALTNSC